MFEKLKTSFEKLVEKYGYDKFLHLFLGGEICACLTIILFSLFAIFVPLSGSLIVAFILSSVALYGLAYYKEAKIDSEISWSDLNFSMLGCVPVGVVVAVAALLLLI